MGVGRFGWFQRELDTILPKGELRLVRDPHRLGLDLWVIERKLPGWEHEHALAALDELHQHDAGVQRFIPVTVAGVGQVEYDTCPEWSVVHICKARSCEHVPPQFVEHDASCYREPNGADLASIRRWLFEFRDAQASMRAVFEERKEREQKKDRDFSDFMKKELKASHLFRQLKFSDAPKTVFKEDDRIVLTDAN